VAAVLLGAVLVALNVLFWVLLVQAILSWIPGLVDGSAWLGSLERAARLVTEPLLAPIRGAMPGGAAVDFSPLILMLAIQVVRWLLGRVFLG
jgi:YggT family protein